MNNNSVLIEIRLLEFQLLIKVTRTWYNVYIVYKLFIIIKTELIKLKLDAIRKQIKLNLQNYNSRKTKHRNKHNCLKYHVLANNY